MWWISRNQRSWCSVTAHEFQCSGGVIPGMNLTGRLPGISYSRFYNEELSDMLMVISPAKTLDYESPLATETFTQPDFLDDACELIDPLKELEPHQVSNLMSISAKLGQLNAERFQSWHTPFSPKNARQAVLAFKGDVYTGLDAGSFSEQDFSFTQKHLRMLSGLYGILKPLDLMQPYRLEMGTKFEL